MSINYFTKVAVAKLSYVRIYRRRRIFRRSITVDISELVNWIYKGYVKFQDELLKEDMFNSTKNVSLPINHTKVISYKSTYIDSDHFKISHSKYNYQFLDSSIIITSSLQDTTIILRVVHLKNVMKEIACV